MIFSGFALTKAQILLHQSVFSTFLVLALCSFLVFIFVEKLFKNRKLSFLAAIIFVSTPAIYYFSILNLSILLLVGLFILACIFWIVEKKFFSIFFLGCFFLSLIFIGKLGLLPSTVFRAGLGSETSYIIDHDLATGFQLHSTLVVRGVNFNRIFYNKAVFGINTIFRNIISSIDFERLVLPYQGYIVLAGNFSRQALPQYLDIWQFVFLLPVVFILGNIKFKKVLPFVVPALAIFLIYGTTFFPLLVPFISIGISVFILGQNKWIKYLIFSIAIMSFLLSISFFAQNSDWWMDQNDVVQHKVWSTLVRKKLLIENVLMTDRYGNPGFYAKAYVGTVPRNLSIGAFRFWEGRDLESYFVGLPGEFVDGGDESRLKGGQIIEKIQIPRADQIGLGGEIWIVKRF